jgi:hypothetical protein
MRAPKSGYPRVSASKSIDDPKDVVVVCIIYTFEAEMQRLIKQKTQEPLEAASYLTSAHHYPRDYAVVVLGVMYPSLLPLREATTSDGPEYLPTDAASGWQSTGLFFDPISSIASGAIETQRQLNGARPSVRAEKTNGSRQAERTKAIQAVTRDLAMLFMRKQT